MILHGAFIFSTVESPTHSKTKAKTNCITYWQCVTVTVYPEFLSFSSCDQWNALILFLSPPTCFLNIVMVQWYVQFLGQRNIETGNPIWCNNYVLDTVHILTTEM